MTTAMHAFFVAIEQSGASVWMREETSPYFVALIFHAWGMALLVGGGLVVCLAVLGLARSQSLHRFAGFFVVMKLGALSAVLSGVALLLGYPAKALTNPVFALKLACLLGAVVAMRWLARHCFTAVAQGLPMPTASRRVAVLALLFWWGVVATGKLLLYSNSVLLVGP